MVCMPFLCGQRRNSTVYRGKELPFKSYPVVLECTLWAADEMQHACAQ